MIAKAALFLFNEIMKWATIGFSKNKKYFESMIKDGSMNHAYLFWGQEMIGKRTFALEVYKLANNRADISDADPDLKILSPKIIDGETKIYIDDSRDMRKFMTLKPYHGPYKFIIINDADRLTTDAANAILKILEEPNKFSILLLISSRPQAMLSTIRSRCESVKFVSIADKMIGDYLNERGINGQDADFIMRVANGRLGWAINCVDDEKIKGVKRSIDSLNEAINMSVADKINFVKKFYEAGDYLQRIDEWMNYLSHGAKTALCVRILSGLSRLYPIISEPQFNHRLALETFFINVEND
ncbi:MAG: hypothetical protein UW46_C0001G0057 [Candidatus Yanofskybacteria bacterium GW2011_GWF1_44_227]|uniref:Polymerase III, delta prime subunit protein n=1 Tax=Candidatus Yanofskybacteria bacterium GW2011_GWE2_40_11 TaxID=1619033 RepID=A0A0G0QK70_9BACT|nr:MAG: hypothetical protein UT69_C0022G0005 [Candidatus Yanofskybacteria bacterium GW2011_GWE1_40_10]KKR40804.1 MAG: hypothetical protein UT75_C0004G0015 [Candidatus Yanofskybacteria bacterium GW2011_GWE2_40_11]KKT15919.1 MAG: hypothetical protein UV97_C0001G0092 [Candidatus Yanofskybacteria bacterium GW2011_GWF2_43_596]KKT53567.1 MAG: hypothetical protein UW46_C0001G0057 [Candidatus Yanofskybacteria bacterium GW2011_GWF1_44_227]HBT80329.1 hypothetical protein [Candidatus Yanofskybacteria bact